MVLLMICTIFGNRRNGAERIWIRLPLREQKPRMELNYKCQYNRMLGKILQIRNSAGYR